MPEQASPTGSIKVLYAVGGLGAGGSEKQLCETVSRLHGHGLEAVVVTFSADSGPRLDQLRRAEVPVLEIGGSGWRALKVARIVGAYWRLLRSWQPDVVYPWLEETSLFLVPLARMLGIPVVVARRNLIGAGIESSFPPVGWAIRAAERRATLVTANSEAVRERARERGIDAEKLRVVPNALELAPFAPPPATGAVRLGYLARMRREKGHLRLLRALSLLDAEREWIAVLGGDGPLLPDVRAEIERLGLAERVELRGEVRDAECFWNGCHVAVLLSDSEGSPNSLLEGARAGRPLVATAVGGSREIVADGTGFLVDPDDEGEIATRLAELIDSERLRDELGARARELTLGRHDPDTVARGHLDVLGEAMRSHRSSRAPAV